MTMLGSHPEGLLLSVRVQAGARANEIRGLYQDALKVAITQVAEKGKANKALTQFLCKQLGLRRSQLALWTGETSADKHFIVRGVGRDELVARIEAMLSSRP